MKKKHHWLVVLLTGFTGFASVGCGMSEKNSPEQTKTTDVPESFKPLFDADKVFLYSIDHTRSIETNERFSGYGVLGKVEIKDPAVRSELAHALIKSVDPNAGAKCFDPRHGLRATRGENNVDYAIRFECEQIQIWSGSGPTTVFMRPPSSIAETFNVHLKAAGIRLAPTWPSSKMDKDKDIKRKKDD